MFTHTNSEIHRLDDGESDFDSPIGFDDDAEVVEAVARMLGQQDLLAVREASED